MDDSGFCTYLGLVSESRLCCVHLILLCDVMMTNIYLITNSSEIPEQYTKRYFGDVLESWFSVSMTNIKSTERNLDVIILYTVYLVTNKIKL